MAGLDENTLLLLHGEDFLDSSQYNVSVTNNGVTVSDSQSKFGGKSFYLNGSSYLSANINVTGDMTIEAWVNKTADNVIAPTPFAFASGMYRGLYVHIGKTADGNSSFGYTLEDGYHGFSNFTPISGNEWHHLAIVRHNGTMLGFVDGVLKSNVQGVKTTNNSLQIGNLPSDPYLTYFTGYIDEIRVSDVARWTEDFTPPDAPYSSVDAPKNVSVPKFVLSNNEFQITWDKPQESVWILERKHNEGDWQQIYTGTENTFTDTAPESGVLKYRVKAEETSYTESEEVKIIPSLNKNIIYGGGISKNNPVKFEPKMVYSWDGEKNSDYKEENNNVIMYPSDPKEYIVENGIKKLKISVNVSGHADKNGAYNLYIVYNGVNKGMEGWIGDKELGFKNTYPTAEFIFDVNPGDRISLKLGDHDWGPPTDLYTYTVTHFELWTAE